MKEIVRSLRVYGRFDLHGAWYESCKSISLCWLSSVLGVHSCTHEGGSSNPGHKMERGSGLRVRLNWSLNLSNFPEVKLVERHCWLDFTALSLDKKSGRQRGKRLLMTELLSLP